MVGRRFAVFGILAALVLAGPAAAQSRRIYLANDDHTDFMWSVDAGQTRDAILRMLDYYLDQAEATDGEPSDFRGRFSADGAYWLWIYESNRTASEFQRLVGKIKTGRVTAPMTLLHLGYGAMPAEAVLRSLYYAGSLERRHGLKFQLAVAMENQSLPYGLGALWAGAGALYSWRGICGCASRIPDAWDRPADMYWWSGPDGSRILMKWYSQIRREAYGIGGYAEIRDPAAALAQTEGSDFRDRVPYSVIGLFGHGGDDVDSRTEAVIQAARAASTADRRVIVSNEIDFFQDFESVHGAQIPTLGLSFGNEWELLTASMAELSGSVKRGVERLRLAEALAALVAARDASFMRGREANREKAWLSLGLYFEHDWTADGPIDRAARAAWQREQAAGFLGYVEALADDASARLGAMIRKEGTRRRFFVFNSLSWSRTGPADLDLGSETEVHAVDLATGKEAPSQWTGPEGSRRLRVWAEEVPSLGYKVFEIVPGAGQAFAGGPTAAGSVLENERYRVTVDPSGAILSLVDKSLGGRELVRAVDGLRINEMGPGAGSLVAAEAGPVSACLRAESAAPLPHVTDVTLYRGGDRIDIRNEITAGFSDVRSWAFSLALDAPEARHEEVGAIITAKTEVEGGTYATRGLRRDWLTLGHFADMSGGGAGLTLSAPDNQFFRLGRSTVERLDTATAQLAVLAGGQVDGPALGIPNQGGDTSFLQRFGLRVHAAYDAVEAMRFALDHQNPLFAAEVTGGASYPADAYAFLSLDDPGVLAWSVKPAEDGTENRTVVRLWNVRDAAADPTLTMGGFSILAAQAVSHIETPIEAAPASGSAMTVGLAGGQWRTFSLKLDGDAASGKGIGRGRIR